MAYVEETYINGPAGARARDEAIHDPASLRPDFGPRRRSVAVEVLANNQGRERKK